MQQCLGTGPQGWNQSILNGSFGGLPTAGLDSPAPCHKVAAGNTEVSFCALAWCKHVLAALDQLVVFLELPLPGGVVAGNCKCHALAMEEVWVDAHLVHQMAFFVDIKSV